MDNFPNGLSKKLGERNASNSLRSLRETGGLVDFSSNDYLGFARSEVIYSWAGQMVSDKDMPRNGATGSRLLTGNHILYKNLEELLKQVHGASALVFNSGYDANLGFFSSVPQRADLVFYDEHAHASIRDGLRMGLAKSFKFKHNDLEDLKRLWERTTTFKKTMQPGDAPEMEIYVVTESVFSMDGDCPDLIALLDFCKNHQCRLVVDEAHAIGVCGSGGKGLLQEMGLHNDVFARIITFGKAMGTHGAAILGPPGLREFLLNFSRSFIYTTGIPPHSVASILASYHFAATPNGGQKYSDLRSNIDFFRKHLVSCGLQSYFTDSTSAIHCCLLPGNDRVKEVAAHLLGEGFDVRPILSPTVSKGLERLRFCLHSYNSRKDIEEVLNTLAEYLGTK